MERRRSPSHPNVALFTGLGGGLAAVITFCALSPNPEKAILPGILALALIAISVITGM